MSIDLLPESRAKNAGTPKKSVWRGNMWWVPVYCANCGKEHGSVPEENCTFAFFLCDNCADKCGPIAGMYMEPDAVFYKKVEEAQLEKYGRLLTTEELLIQLDDVNSFISRLARDRLRLTPDAPG